MRTCLNAVLLLSFGAVQLLEATPSVLAADLVAAPRVVKHKRIVHGRVVRDYDGTPILLRPAGPVLVRDGYGGTRVVLDTYDAIPVMRATPRYYLNGQPVLPHGVRSWPSVRSL